MNGKLALGAIIAILIIGVILFGFIVTMQRSRLRRFYNWPGAVNVYRMREVMRGRFWQPGFSVMRPRFGFQSGLINGTITNISGSGITIKLPDGTNRTVNITSSTQYSQLTTVTQSNLKQGQNVTITGQLDQKGSLSAQQLRINLSQ